jgi:hypothetical protein
VRRRTMAEFISARFGSRRIPCASRWTAGPSPQSAPELSEINADTLRLESVGVLIFIDEDVIESSTYFCGQIVIRFKLRCGSG